MRISVFLSILIGILIGWVIGMTVITNECKSLGAFYADGTAYTCEVQKND